SHPHAQHAAEAAEAVAGYGGARAFWGMHDAMYEHQDALADADLVYYASRLGLDGEQLAKDLAAGTFAKRVREDFRSGVRSGVNATPTFFVNGARYEGAWADEDRFLRALRDALEVAEMGAAAPRL